MLLLRDHVMVLLLALAWCALASSCIAVDWDLKSDTWVSTDALGRQMPVYVDCPAPRADKFIGMFYFAWHASGGTPGPYDITQLLAANPTNPQYGPEGQFHWWAEPEAGYFNALDTWVIRRNLSMLADAGVDVIIFDVTNGFTYLDVVRQTCSIATSMRSNGLQVPQMAFITYSGSPDTVKYLYNNFYALNQYSSLWFSWQGKPIIFGYRDAQLQDGTYLSQTIKDFFTWRESWAWDAGQRKWQWIDTYPQDYGWDQNSSVAEEIPVCVASHPTNNIGRSYSGGREPTRDTYGLCTATAKGLCFNEQWQRALQVDPSFIWVTGWNEWVAQRWIATSTGTKMMGKSVPVGGTFFVDCYNQEYSRDIEPMKGGHTDSYYYQLIAKVRKFKGVRPPEAPSSPTTIAVDGLFDDWIGVGPEYRDTKGDTAYRAYAGWGSLYYSNYTGRNDIIKCLVARDADSVYFYAETKSNLTTYSGSNWMLLFIDSDFNPYTGWFGYDYVVNYGGVTATTTTVKRNTGGWNWTLVSNVPYKASGTKLEIAVPRSVLGLGTAAPTAFDFHWADNISSTGDIAEFSTKGDSAPNRRANYRYSPFVPGPVWEYTRDGDTESWSAANNVTNLGAANGLLSGDVSGTDPFITNQRYPSIDAGTNPYVHVRMKCNTGSSAEIFWGTAAQPSHVSGRSVAFAIIPDGQFHDYVIHMTSNPQWAGWVNTLRLDPTTAPSGHFEVDYIRLRRIPPDTVAPTGSVLINSGDHYAQSATVTLTISASDDFSGVSKMRLSNDGVFDTEQWVDYATASIWTLTAGDGLKIAHVQFMDSTGNVSQAYQDSITVDSTPPSTPNAPADSGAYSQNTAVTFTWDAADDPVSGVLGYECMVGSRAEATDLSQGFVTAREITLTGLPSMAYYCRVRARDNAGNVGSWSTASDGVYVVSYPGVTIGTVKSLMDGVSVGLSAKIVTAIYYDDLYVQEPVRSAGIKVATAAVSGGLGLGEVVDLAGILSTTSEGERYLASPIVSLNCRM